VFREFLLSNVLNIQHVQCARFSNQNEYAIKTYISIMKTYLKINTRSMTDRSTPQNSKAGISSRNASKNEGASLSISDN
jgi:hypothetical protein